MAAALRFLTRMGVLKYNSHNGCISTVIREEEGAFVGADGRGRNRIFTHKKPLVTENEVICKIIRRLHGCAWKDRDGLAVKADGGKPAEE